MLYTKLGQRGPEVSRLGFGCMRLPMGKDGKVDRSLAVPLLRKAVDMGVTYFDSAVFYCRGDSQPAVGEALEGLRDRVILSTKNHLHTASDDEWWARLEESLKFLRTPYLDIYNFHGLTWKVYEESIQGPSGKMALMKRAKTEGKIRHICCSFHDVAESLVKLVDTGEFDAITVQYNLLNRQLEEAMTYAHQAGVGIVVMGPVGGGRLGVNSERLRELTGGDVGSSAEAALRFVLGHPGASVALSGMSNIDMLNENVQAVAEKKPFTRKQLDNIDSEVQRAKSVLGVACTACDYCQPCPYGVDIPENFKVYNEFKSFGLTEYSQTAYSKLVNRASACTECGACVPKCPQKIQIPNMLRKVVAELDKNFEGAGASLLLRGVKGKELDALLVVRSVLPTAENLSYFLTLEDGCKADPGGGELGHVEPFGATTRNLRIGAPDGVGYLKGKCRIAWQKEFRDIPVLRPFFIIPSGHWRRHQAQILPEDFGSLPDYADSHGYVVALQHDEDVVRIKVDLRLPMESLAKPGETRGSRMEMFVDMRPGGYGRPNVYEDGAEQFFIYPGDSVCRAKSEKTYSLNLKTERTPEGCHFSLELPFREFIKPDAPIPKEIGLDWMLVAAGGDGSEAGHPTYGRLQELYKSPRAFARAFLL